MDCAADWMEGCGQVERVIITWPTCNLEKLNGIRQKEKTKSNLVKKG